MDPLTHGLVGVAISAFSGTAVSIDNPYTIGAMLGAMAPDLDFVIRLFKDDAAYMTHHRGISHSIPFLVGFSVAITVILSQIGFLNFGFLSTLLWTFLGALSHTGLDILNSYGAKLFRKKRKANILTLYDPVITLVGLGLILNGRNSIVYLIVGLLTVLTYLMIRKLSRNQAKKQIQNILDLKFSNSEVHVKPSLKAFYKWDFVAHSSTHDIVGQYNPWKIFSPGKECILILKVFDVEDPYYYEQFRASNVGEIFTSFSPNLHIMVTHDLENNQIVLRATDLRYFIKEKFMHHATLILDGEMQFVSSYLHPYSLNKAIPIGQ